MCLLSSFDFYGEGIYFWGLDPAFFLATNTKLIIEFTLSRISFFLEHLVPVVVVVVVFSENLSASQPL